MTVNADGQRADRGAIDRYIENDRLRIELIDRPAIDGDRELDLDGAVLDHVLECGSSSGAGAAETCEGGYEFLIEINREAVLQVIGSRVAIEQVVTGAAIEMIGAALAFQNVISQTAPQM